MQEFDSLVDTLHLQPHPEGGFYREIYRSETIVKEQKQVEKSAFTSIYYLLSGNDFSSWHRIKSDEAWYFHVGCDVIIYFLDQKKLLQTVQLGLKSQNFQTTIPANTWFSAKPVDETSYCLVSCAVAPGFDFNDFEIGERESLLKEFGHSSDQIEVIKALTRI
jgi:predicted cupin superfamily sugar epimerase